MNDDEIAALLAWAKKQPPGPVRNMARVLAKQLRIQQEIPDSEIMRKVIASTLAHLKSKIEEAQNAQKGC